jgi:hypothetical protein
MGLKKEIQEFVDFEVKKGFVHYLWRRYSALYVWAHKRDLIKLAFDFAAGLSLLAFGRGAVLGFAAVLKAMEPMATSAPLSNQMLFYSVGAEAYAAIGLVCLPVGFSLLWGIITSRIKK